MTKHHVYSLYFCELRGQLHMQINNSASYVLLDFCVYGDYALGNRATRLEDEVGSGIQRVI